jgi:hypothetical protein
VTGSQAGHCGEAGSMSLAGHFAGGAIIVYDETSPRAVVMAPDHGLVAPA